MTSPSFDEFARLAATGELIPLSREILFDADTAVTAYWKLTRGADGAAPPFGFLLESVEGGEAWARYSFLGTAPRGAWRVDADGRTRGWTPERGWEEPRACADPLAEFEALLRRRSPVDVPGLPRFTGGAVGFFGYDAVRWMERLGPPPPDSLGLPQALLMFTDVVLAIDNLFGRARVMAMVDVAGAADAGELRRLYEDAAARIDAVVRRLETAAGPPFLDLSAADADPPYVSTYARDAFERDVARVKEYIEAGDAFQVVLSQRLTVPLEAESFDLYRALRSINPSPYLYYLELDGLDLVGSSPEVLVRAEEGRVTLRPIAGTRPRGRDPAEDARLAEDLLADAKERAEHLMLLDLGRNDVGRVAEFGEVRVTERMRVERYSHVLHLVSQVEGRLREGLSAIDVLRACFPAGTVSGAPKIRAMQIIDELEPASRGPYAGAVGYFAYGGKAMDTAIAIRTLIAAGGLAHVQAGAGIVADSVPAAEYEETLAKARALLRVLRMTPARARSGGGT